MQIEAALEAPVAPDASSVEAGRAPERCSRARRLQVENRTISLQQELVTYAAERPLLPHRRELAARDGARLQEQLSQLDAAVDALRRLDASQQVNEARLQALRLGIAAVAVANNGLTARRQSVVSQLDRAEDDLDQVNSALADLTDRFTRTRERVAAIGRRVRSGCCCSDTAWGFRTISGGAGTFVKNARLVCCSSPCNFTGSVRRLRVLRSPRQSSAPPCWRSSSFRPASRPWSTRLDWSAPKPDRPVPSARSPGFRHRPPLLPP